MSSRLLTDLRIEMQPRAEAFVAAVAAAGIDMLVTCTLRSMAEQTALFALGRTVPGPIRTLARAGQSAHNYGLAMDIVPMVSGKPDWDGVHPVWAQVGDLGEKAGLDWYGAPGAEFYEEAHFQMPGWRFLIQQATA